MTKHTGRNLDRIRVTRVTSPTKTNETVPRASSRRLPLTGVRCQACQQPVVAIDQITEFSLTLLCPACGHRWSAATQGPQPY
jgi:hypothetical protein